MIHEIMNYIHQHFPDLTDAGIAFGVYRVPHGGHKKVFEALLRFSEVKRVIALISPIKERINGRVLRADSPYKEALSINGLITIASWPEIERTVMLPGDVEKEAELFVSKNPAAIAINTDAIKNPETGDCNLFERLFFEELTNGNNIGFENIRNYLDLIRNKATEYNAKFRYLQRTYKKIPEKELKKLNEIRDLDFTIIPFTYVNEDGIPTKFTGDTSIYSKILAKMPHIVFIEPQGAFVAEHKDEIEIGRTYNGRDIYRKVMNMLYNRNVMIDSEAPNSRFYEPLFGEEFFLDGSVIFRNIYRARSEFPHFVAIRKNQTAKLPSPFDAEYVNIPCTILKSA